VDITEQQGAVSFRVRVIPRSKNDAIDGDHEGVLKVRIKAPPVDDRANEALRRLLAERLEVRVSAVTIVSGDKSPTKRVSIAGVTREQAMRLAT
jgi:uncharacterized protein